jgi:hypothetical protein
MTIGKGKANFIKRTTWLIAALFWLAMFLYLVNESIQRGYRLGVAVSSDRLTEIIIVFCVWPFVSAGIGAVLGLVQWSEQVWGG